MRVTSSVIGLSLIVSVGVVTAAPTAVAAAPTVAINELHYNPLDDNPASEFIELVNTSGSRVDLGGWCIDGIDYCFPGGTTVAAGGFVVRTGDQYEGALSNGGEDIALIDRNGTVIDFVEYDDKEEWPGLADGEGDSLQRRDLTAPTDNPGNWMSAPPSPGIPNPIAASGVLPSFSDVEHTEYPAAGEPVLVTAELAAASAATMIYRVGFGPEVTVAMSENDGVHTATIPGQAAGSLIRYRLSANRNGRVGTWPRQGDGSDYRGTTVQRDIDTGLPVFEIFMGDGLYETMVNDLTLSGDDGYSMVFAHEGQVFSNARIRVKGQSSRTFPKKKFKIILPQGYDLESDLFPDDVDEFAIHSGWIDRSFLRETIASEFMTEAGTRAQQAFPIRFEKNGQFHGLYTYVEQPDGTYRDRYDLDDSEVYEVGPDFIYGQLLPSDATKSEADLRARYDKETFEYDGDDRLRNFITQVNSRSGAAERAWIYDNVDVPSAINIVAASMVIQNQDWGVKNYRLVFGERGRVSFAQNDYDFTFGRRWSMSEGPFDTDVYVGGAFEHPGGPFWETFFFDPELRAMVSRRIRTLTEEQLAPNVLHPRVVELANLVAQEAIMDRAIWGTYGGSANPTTEAIRINEEFIRPQYERLLGTLASQGRVAPTSQPAKPNVVIEAVRYDGIEHVVIRNRSGDSVDLSLFEIPEIDATITGGTILLPGRSAILVHEDVEQLAGAYRPHLFAGLFDESVGDATDGLTLHNRNGDVVTSWTLVPPKQLTEFEGEADRSALVSVVAVLTAAAGHVQALDCNGDPGDTANLTTDGAGQVRSSLALVPFDGDGTACLYNHSAMHMVADVQGYFADGAIDDVPDRRLTDTRSGPRPGAGAVTRVTGGRPGETALVGLFAIDTSPLGHLSVVPCAATGSPAETANLTWSAPGSILAAMAFVEFDDRGEVCVVTHTPSHVVVDLQGYLGDTSFDDITDKRLVDTRNGARPGDDTSVVITGTPNSTAVVALSAVLPIGAGYLQVHDCDDAPGRTANVNYDPGSVISGLATVRFDDDGEACVYTLRSSDIVVDLQGYFAPGAFDDITDVRALDTR